MKYFLDDFLCGRLKSLCTRLFDFSSNFYFSFQQFKQLAFPSDSCICRFLILCCLFIPFGVLNRHLRNNTLLTLSNDRRYNICIKVEKLFHLYSPHFNFSHRGRSSSSLTTMRFCSARGGRGTGNVAILSKRKLFLIPCWFPL